jgi:Putative phage serine protease XkdF
VVAEEQRFVLGLAYQAGPDPRIAKGLDGGRDFFTAAELERACHTFLPGGGQVGLYHMDDPSVMGHMTVTENYIYRNEVPWVAKAADGSEQVIKCGDWVVGGICDDIGWQLVKSGKVRGFSPQGVARRRRVRKVSDG